MRREYIFSVFLNEVWIRKVVIDPHFEKKHTGSITDGIILRLVKTLDGEMVAPTEENPPYAYFVRDRIGLDGKFYKLVWLLEDGQSYIGIINAYRR